MITKKASFIPVTIMAVIVTVILTSCFSVKPLEKPETVETVTWAELADQDTIKANDNRLVTLQVKYLGPDVAVLPAQALYGVLAGNLYLNHCEISFDYTTAVVTSLDSFLLALPANTENSNLVEKELKEGDILQVTGLTEYVEAGFGMFKHLVLTVNKLEVVR